MKKETWVVVYYPQSGRYSKMKKSTREMMLDIWIEMGMFFPSELVKTCDSEKEATKFMIEMLNVDSLIKSM